MQEKQKPRINGRIWRRARNMLEKGKVKSSAKWLNWGLCVNFSRLQSGKADCVGLAIKNTASEGVRCLQLFLRNILLVAIVQILHISGRI